VDGNKRTGAVAAIVFLDLNGKEFDAPEKDLEMLVLQVARGATDKARVVEFIRQHVH